MRLGEIGPAILNYLRAKSLLPRNESIEANLKYAINKTVDRLDPPRTGFIQELCFWVQAASLNEYFQLSILLNIFFWTVSIGFLCLRSPTWKTLKADINGSSFICLYFYWNKISPTVLTEIRRYNRQKNSG